MGVAMTPASSPFIPRHLCDTNHAAEPKKPTKYHCPPTTPPQPAAPPRMMAHYDSHGLPGGNPLVLRSILGREPRSLKDYFRELASR